jgi:hypothetical protein
MAVSIWRRNDVRSSSLEHNEARKRNEPYVDWDREGRMLFISEVPSLQPDQLYALIDDMEVRREGLQRALEVEQARLNLCDGNSLLESKRSVKAMASLNMSIQKTKRFIKDARRALNQLSPPVKQRTGPVDFDFVQGKREYFKRKAMMRKLIEILGKDQVDALMERTRFNSAKDFRNWAKDASIRPDWIDKILNSEQAEARRLRQLAQASPTHPQPSAPD